MEELEVLIQIMAFLQEQEETAQIDYTPLLNEILKQNYMMQQTMFAIMSILFMILILIIIIFAIFLSKWFFKTIVSNIVLKHI